MVKTLRRPYAARNHAAQGKLTLDAKVGEGVSSELSSQRDDAGAKNRMNRACSGGI